MKILPRERSGYEVGWLVWRVFESAGQADNATTDALTATFFVRAEFHLRHGEAAERITGRRRGSRRRVPHAQARQGLAEPITDRPIVFSGDVPHAEARQGLAYPTDYVPYKPLG